MLKLFSRNKLYILALMPILAAIFWFRLYLYPSSVEVPTDLFYMPLYRFWVWLFPVFVTKLGSQIFTIPFLLIQAYIIALFGTQHRLFDIRTFLPATIFIVLSSVLIPSLGFHPAHMGNIFLLLALNEFLKSSKSENLFKPFFNIGFLLSIGSLFYIGIFPFFFAFLASLLFVHPFNWRFWLVSFIGAILPYTSYFAYVIITNGNLLELGIDIVLGHLLADSLPKFNETIYGYIAFISLLNILAITRIIYSLPKRNIVTRRNYLSLISIFAASTIFFISTPLLSIEIGLVILPFVSIFLSEFFIRIKRRYFDEILFILVLVISLMIIILN